MRLRTALIAALVALALGGAAALLAEEQIEHVLAPETGALRPPSGEWIKSVEGERAELWAVGDADPPGSRGVARMLRRVDPDRILYLGDVYPKGSAADFRRWAKPFGNLVKRMAPTPGNHDWPEATEGYEPYWKKVSGEVPPTYYAFNAGGWRILSVNGEHDAQRPVENWLAHETRSGGNCRIAFWHRPRYTAGHHEGGNKNSEEYWEAVAGKALIIVNGHDHNMQRMKPDDGIVQFISGAGGKKLYTVDESYRRLAFSNERRFGALRLRLRPGRADWAFVAVGRRVLDKGTLRCQA